MSLDWAVVEMGVSVRWTQVLVLGLGLLSLLPVGAAAQQVERVQPGSISSEVNETFPMVDPVDGSLWFSRYERGFNNQTIWRAPRDGDHWGTAAVVGFSGEWGDRAPRFSPDGRRLFFTSNRPADGGATAGTMHIWMMERDGSAWGAPIHLPTPVNVDGKPSIHAAVGPDGSLYVPSARDGGLGRSDIYRVPDASRSGGSIEHLGPPINDEHSQPDLVMAPDGSWMIFAMTDHPNGFGGDDLYLSRREGDGWTDPQNLGAAVNSSDYEYGPSVGPDGEWLYFNSHRDGQSDIFRVRVAEVVR